MATVSEPRKLRSGEIERLDPYVFMAVIGKRVIHPGGRAACGVRKVGHAA